VDATAQHTLYDESGATAPKARTKPNTTNTPTTLKLTQSLRIREETPALRERKGEKEKEVRLKEE